jgi:(1->4)-alpha-D-glucan 1-alpha-D-glucosylmutase
MLTALRENANPTPSLARELAQHWEDGQIKLYAIWKALNLRRERAELFSKGDFLELKAAGPAAEHILAILRHHKREWALLVAPRFLARAQEERKDVDPDNFWHEVSIRLPDAAPRSWQNIFTGDTFSPTGDGQKSLAIDKMLLHFPVALLT